MAMCTTCGRPAGILSDQCRDCKRQQQERRQGEIDVSERRANAERSAHLDAQRADYVAACKALIASNLAVGRPAYLHNSVYLQVDSEVMGEPAGVWDIALLQSLGMEGWEIVGIVPRTSGIGLTNTTAGTRYPETSWGGGIGGNIVGAYILLRYTMIPDNGDGSASRVEKFLNDVAARMFPALE